MDSKKPPSHVSKEPSSQVSKKRKKQKLLQEQQEKQRIIDMTSFGFVGSIGSVGQSVLFSITKEEVTKAMKRDECITNKWMDTFLRVAPLLGLANPNDVYLFPFILPMISPGAGTFEEVRKEKMTVVANFFNDWSKNIKQVEWSERFKSVAIIIHVDAFTGKSEEGEDCFGEHYMVLNIHFETHTATFYDSISDCGFPENRSFNLEAWDKSLILSFAYRDMSKSGESSNGSVWVTEDEQL